MHAHSKKRRKLTEHQAKLLWRISKSPLMLTKTADGKDRYHLQNGRGVNRRSAQTLIADGYLTPRDAGLFPGMAQSWVASTYID
jgi:hypothetical protein